MNKVLLSAHRCGLEELNTRSTIKGVKRIRKLDVDLIEFDVRVTKDKKFVIWHDEKAEIKGKLKAVFRSTCEEFLASGSDRCTLAEMLEAVKGYAVAHVDLKDARCETEIADYCESVLGIKGFILTTLYDKSVKKVRRLRPNVNIGLSIGRPTRGMSKYAEFKIRLSEYFPEWRIAKCNPKFLAICYMEAGFGAIHWAKYDNLPVLLWTVDEPAAIQKAWGNPLLWAFTTNYPQQALRIRKGENQ